LTGNFVYLLTQHLLHVIRDRQRNLKPKHHGGGVLFL